MADLTMGQRIAEERKKLGISQEGLGEKMGVSRQAISKWEADGAVPEIDKLIALSKLFGVSVGWLLGVEETLVPVENQTDTLSEKQLQMIEEIVKKYQPKPVAERLRLMLITCIAALGLVAITVMTLASMGIFEREAENTAALEALRYEVNSQLAELDSRITGLNTTQAQPTPALLADYGLEIVSIVSGDRPAAEVSFSAVPSTWQEGDSASLSVRREGMKTILQPCQWDGAFLTARVSLETADGYELCLTINHADGTQEQQVLNDSDIKNLKKTLSITAVVTPARWSYENNILSLYNYEFQVTMPLAGKFYGALAWKQVDLVLTYSNGEEIGRCSLLNAMDDQDAELLASSDIWMQRSEIYFNGLELSSDAGILLWLYAETNNGLTLMHPADAWTTDANGRLLAVQTQ